MILRDTRRNIEKILNESGLPIDAIYFIIKDIYNEVIEIYSNEITAEEQAVTQNKEEETETENNKEDKLD